MRLIAANAGDNGSVVVERVTASKDANFGYNAATGEFQDLMVNGIIDPTKVIRCALENSCSVAKIFLTSDVVVCEIPENEPMIAGGARHEQLRLRHVNGPGGEGFLGRGGVPRVEAREREARRRGGISAGSGGPDKADTSEHSILLAHRPTIITSGHNIN